jgi:hypothetical protein
LADVLTAPHVVAAIVLCVAGVAKLRSPWTAASALGVRSGVIRAFSIYELALGAGALAWSVLSPLLAVTYAGLAVLTLVLARRSESCGCFGAGDAPASAAQSALSFVLALACAGPAHGAGWIVGRPLGTAVVLALGVAAAAYGIVVVYSELPPAWRAWSVS